MKLDQTVNLRVEDFPSQKDWIDRLFTSLNPVLNGIQQIFDQSVDFETNIKSVTKSFDSTSLTVPITFAWTFAGATPADLRILAATNGTTPTVLLPAWSYNASTQAISISSLYEVTATGIAAVKVGPRYRFSVRASI